AGPAARAQDFGDHSFAAILRRRKPQHLDDDLVIALSTLSPGIAHVDTVAEDRTVHANIALGISFEISADEQPGGAFEHLQDFADRPEVGARGVSWNAHQDFVARGGVERIACPDQNFGAGFATDGVRTDETEATAGATKDAGHGAMRSEGTDGVILAKL